MRRPNGRRFSGRRAGSRRGSNLARSPAQGMTRRSFLGTAAAGVGVAVAGRGRVARATGTPEYAEGAVVTINSSSYPQLIFVTAEDDTDPENRYVGAAIGRDPEDLSYVINKGVEVRLPHDLGMNIYEGLYDVHTFCDKNVPCVIWRNLPTIPNPYYSPYCDPESPHYNLELCPLCHPESPQYNPLLCPIFSQQNLKPKDVVIAAFLTTFAFHYFWYLNSPPTSNPYPCNNPNVPGDPPGCITDAAWSNPPDPYARALKTALIQLRDGTLNILNLMNGQPIFYLSDYLAATGEAYGRFTGPMVGQSLAVAIFHGVLQDPDGYDLQFKSIYIGEVELNEYGLPDIMNVIKLRITLR